ncbi:hypothetical protein AAT19DRAFT_9845 [Rhodotorula toruloides]|uniref:Uncharacterized protein n=1 Tax=Rhodotorula toruloides TaxID=5286 RepID=A0A2T0A150_RHOTO|nr:hypothetical protein AAT19DRAFT_9845 [Rhodotorula toruloides]
MRTRKVSSLSPACFSLSLPAYNYSRAISHAQPTLTPRTPQEPPRRPQNFLTQLHTGLSSTTILGTGKHPSRERTSTRRPSSILSPPTGSSLNSLSRQKSTGSTASLESTTATSPSPVRKKLQTMSRVCMAPRCRRMQATKITLRSSSRRRLGCLHLHLPARRLACQRPSVQAAHRQPVPRQLESYRRMAPRVVPRHPARNDQRRRRERRGAYRERRCPAPLVLCLQVRLCRHQARRAGPPQARRQHPRSRRQDFPREGDRQHARDLPGVDGRGAAQDGPCCCGVRC